MADDFKLVGGVMSLVFGMIIFLGTLGTPIEIVAIAPQQQLLSALGGLLFVGIGVFLLES